MPIWAAAIAPIAPVPAFGDGFTALLLAFGGGESDSQAPNRGSMSEAWAP